jgi:hypothetical protein
VDGMTITEFSQTIPGFSESQTVEVIPTVTSIPTLAVVTSTGDYDSDLTVVEVLLPTGAGTPINVSSV